MFEITDFTTASEWERFIAQLEEVIHEWKLVTVPRLPPLKKVTSFITSYSTGILSSASLFVGHATFGFPFTFSGGTCKRKVAGESGNCEIRRFPVLSDTALHSL